MPCTRHIIVCEGESEWAYLQRLQSFLLKQELPVGVFEPPLRLIAPERCIAKGGRFSTLKKYYNHFRKENKNSSIKIWADFDLYHRNDNQCAVQYALKTAGIPDFYFSFHNFEDFYALHLDVGQFKEWLQFGGQGHFSNPLHSYDYLPEFQKIFPDYKKGELPVDFISWDSLKNLKRNKAQRPTSNPHNLQEIGSFADFLINEIDTAYPSALL